MGSSRWADIGNDNLILEIASICWVGNSISWSLNIYNDIILSCKSTRNTHFDEISHTWKYLHLIDIPIIVTQGNRYLRSICWEITAMNLHYSFFSRGIRLRAYRSDLNIGGCDSWGEINGIGERTKSVCQGLSSCRTGRSNYCCSNVVCRLSLQIQTTKRNLNILNI